MQNNKWAECKGCLLFTEKYKKCDDDSLPIFGGVHCPCKECLIRMICEDGCESYKQYRKLMEQK